MTDRDEQPEVFVPDDAEPGRPAWLVPAAIAAALIGLLILLASIGSGR